MEFREPIPSDKVQIRQRAELQPPAICAMCGNGTCRDGYVDVDVWYEWEGQVYFCHNCGLEIARALGCLPPDQTQFLIGQNQDFAKELASLKEAHERATSRLAIYDSVIAGAATSDPALMDAEQGTLFESADSNAPAPTADAGEPKSKEPVKSARRGDVKRSTVRNSPGITL